MLRDAPISFEEAKRLLASRHGYASLPKAIETLDRLLAWAEARRNPTFECIECGETDSVDQRKMVGDAELCYDCYDAM